MAVIQKTLFAENLDRYQTFVTDTNPNSDYFKITELADTLTGGKNAFLIQGSEYLVPDTLIKIEIKDANGDIIYHEPGEGIVSSSVGGTEIVTEYYEGVSKVVAVHIYPDTAYGTATITILGELSSYNNNGLNTPIPIEWEGKYNVKWQKQINVNPSLANTTKIRFYRRPTATISETLSPIYTIVSGSKVESNVVSSFANIKISQMETFAGDVKRIKVFRTSLGDISDADLIQDILVESKELLTSYALSGSVVGNSGLFTSEVLSKLWNPTTLTTELTSSRIDNGVKLNGSGYFKYTSSLNLSDVSVYELGIDAFYSASSASDLGIYISGSNNGDYLIGTLNGITPTKNLKDQTIQFTLPYAEPTASLYFSQSQGEWHVGNVSLKLTQDTAFSPDEISFVTSMPTVIGNETFKFNFEFYDVNNNYVPVAVTQSALFTGGNNNVGGTITLISASASSSLSQLYAVSSSISGTMTVYSSSASGSILSLSSSVSTSVLQLTGSISSSLSSSIGYASSSVYTLSGSVSSSIAAVSSSVSQSVYQGLLGAYTRVQNLADGNYSGSFISGSLIYAPVIGGQLGYFSTLFKVGKSPNSIYLDARQSPRKIFIGGAIPSGDTEYSGAYNNTNTPVYLDSNGYLSLSNKLLFDPTANAGAGGLTVGGTINASAGTFSGTITATGTISGGTITGATFSAGAISGGTIRIGSGTSVFSADTNGLYLGDTTFASAPFRVAPDGTLTATSATITGALVATSLTLQSGVTVPNTKITGLGTLSTLNSVNSTYIDDNSVTTGKVVANAIDASHISALNFTGKTATFTQGTIGGWNINPDKLSSPPDSSGYSRLIFSPSPLIGVTNTAGAVKLSIRAGDLTDLGAGASVALGFGSYDVASFSDSVSSANGRGTNGSTLSFTVPQAGTYQGNLSMAATSTLGTTPSPWSGYFYMSLNCEIASDSSFNNILATGTFGSNSRGTAGSLSIGATSSNILSVSFPTSGTYYARIYWYRVLYSNTTSPTTFYSNTSDTSTTNLGSSVEATELTDKGFQVVNGSSVYLKVQREGYTGAYVKVGGDISATGNITAYASSDKRLKENIIPIENSLDKIQKLDGVEFDWTDEYMEKHVGDDPDANLLIKKHDVGVIAQQVKEVLPEVVVERKDGYLAVRYEKVVPLLIEAIKELKKEINELKNK